MKNEMTFAGAVKNGFTKWRDYRGVASRSEYWYFVLFAFLLGIVTSVIDSAISSGNKSDSFITVSNLVSLALVFVQLPLRARRFHDVGFSGWWQAIDLVPITVALLRLPQMIDFAKSALWNRALNGEHLTKTQNMHLFQQMIDVFGLPLLLIVITSLFQFVLTLLKSKPSWRGNKYAPVTEPVAAWGFEVASNGVAASKPDNSDSKPGSEN